MGPLQKTKNGNQYILTVIDGFTKFSFFEPVKTTRSDETIQKLSSIFKVFGFPRKIIADRGTSFTSDTFTRFCEDSNIHLIHIATKTPRSNGQIERYHQTLMPALLKLTEDEPETWNEAPITNLQLSVNGTVQKSTLHRPSELLFGYKLRTSNSTIIPEILSREIEEENYLKDRQSKRGKAGEEIKKNQARAKTYYDNKRKEHIQYRKGDLVMMERGVPPQDRLPKMGSKYVGPFRVHKVLDNDRYVVKDIPGCQLTQKAYEGVLPPERLKPWVRYEDSDSDSVEDDSESGPAELLDT